MIRIAYLKTKVVIDQDGVTTTLYDFNKISAKIDFEPTNNKAEIEIANPSDFFESGQFKLNENDRIYIYAKIVESNSDSAFTSDDIIFNGLFIEHSINKTTDELVVTIDVIDFGYQIFNRMLNESYLNDGLKTDEILINVIKNNCEKPDGSGDYSLTFTGVETTRPDGSAFPIIEPTFTKDPVYDVIEDLSSTIWTNSETEIDYNNRKITKKMIFRIDGNEVKWFYPTEELVDTITNDSEIISAKQSLNTEGSVNFLILECGEDLNGDVITTYIYDEKSGTSPNTTEQYQTVKKLAGQNDDYDNQYLELRAKYIALDDNNGFIKAVRQKAQSFSEIWFKNNRATTTISLEVPLKRYDIGEYIDIELSNFDKGNYEIKSVNYNISNNSATTTLILQKVVD